MRSSKIFARKSIPIHVLLTSDVVINFCSTQNIRWFRDKVFPVWVHPPRDAAELAKAMGPYCALGLNGAFESTDAVHLHWGANDTCRITE